MVIKPPPPRPVNPLIRIRAVMFVETEQPKQPSMNVKVETKKHILLPNISENLENGPVSVALRDEMKEQR